MYTLDDLRGRYVRVDTPEAEIFLGACEELGLKWGWGDTAKNFRHNSECVAVHVKYIRLARCDAEWFQSNGYKPFKTTTERDRFIEACQSGDFGAVYDEFIKGARDE